MLTLQLNQSRLRESLQVLERAVIQNNYLKKLALYRENEVQEATGSDEIVVVTLILR